MTDSQPLRKKPLPPLSQAEQLDRLADEFERHLRSGDQARIEEYLDRVESTLRSALLRELIALEIEFRRRAGEAVAIDEYQQRFPDDAGTIEAAFSVPRKATPESTMSVLHDDSARNGDADNPEPLTMPTAIGRYEIRRVLGHGGFGTVYLAHDSRLERLVALKVPKRNRFMSAQHVDAFIHEGRMAAQLKHPGLVAVYDVQAHEDGAYLIEEYIEGQNLADWATSTSASPEQLARLTIEIAEAIGFAHQRNMVHRDLKPGNILIDRQGQAHVTDFGLALNESLQRRRKGEVAGTAAYMSPEQVRGETHRLDGRTDLWSLGVVLYELLTDQRPFSGNNRDEIFDEIEHREPKPPRMLNREIPTELERICLKCLAKQQALRYSSAAELVDDLRHWLDRGSERRAALPVAMDESKCAKTGARVVPKGLRSFDASDADFYLELLPGPHDREGLPPGVRFWKTQIDETDRDRTFPVGIMYGPSGCGKSSLVKAALLPRLARHVLPIYIEATAADTEVRLLKALRKACPELPADESLPELIADLRQSCGSGGRKVLVVLDQFEQWLHARDALSDTQLISALRQCDGAAVQCLVLVRDDFWMSVTRFMHSLEIPLLEGHNSAAVDQFDPTHARKVLSAFGRAYGKLPDAPAEPTPEQGQFLDQTVRGLAQEGKVISVRLALFAEMMKGRAWTPSSLAEVGGTQGVGAAFLESTFSAKTAPPTHRFHQEAARRVLKALLPALGTDIKGEMKSHDALQEASGYAGRPADFESLLAILDGELRLITPTEPDQTSGNEAPSQTGDKKYYQLTHDYLVSSLRDWLTRKQRETRRGRAELVLADRAAVWSTRPANRQLPSLLQWIQIRWLTVLKNWTPQQRKMMQKAGRYHTTRGLVMAFLFALAGWGARETHGILKADALRDRLMDAKTSELPAIFEDLESYRRWLNPLLQAAAASEANKDTTRELHARLALLRVDPGQVDYLYRRLLDASHDEVPVVLAALAPYKVALSESLWNVVEAPAQGKEHQRLRAASALAEYDPDNERWETVKELIANDLVSVPAVYLGSWLDSLRPVRVKLIRPLSGIYRSGSRRNVERSLATDILADYAADDPKTLADLLMEADDKQFAVIYPRLEDQGHIGASFLTGEIDKKPPTDLPSSDEKREALAKRQANAAVALLRMDRPERVWPLLKHSPDPRVRSYLIHRLSPLGADSDAVIKRLDDESDITIRRALLLSLGEFSEKELPPADRISLLPKLHAMYRNEADAGLHASAEWLLRIWQDEDWLRQVNDEWAKDREQQGRKFESIQRLAKQGNVQTPQWYVNSQSQTMVVIPGPTEFLMGSPQTEGGRQGDEVQHKRLIGRTFALSSKPVTVAQYQEFAREYALPQPGAVSWPSVVFTHAADLPAVGIDWYSAAKYCNCLSEAEG